MKSDNFSEINPLYLIGLYLICPILLFVCIIDIGFFQGALLKELPSRPEEFAFWAIIFVFPHIISSFLTLADKSNISKYGSKISKATLTLLIISAVLFGMLPAIVPNDFIRSYYFGVSSILGFAIIYHLISQQLGVGLILTRTPPNLNFNIFKWLSVILSYILFLTLIIKPQIPVNYNYLINYVYFICFIMLILCISFCRSFLSTSQQWEGKVYMYANILMIFSVWFLSLFDYAIFAMMIPRILHDFTAFIFYSNHDTNKFKHEKSNYIYRALNKLPIPIAIISPILGISIAFTLNHSFVWVTLYAMIILEFLHYYIESFIWKGKGSHREFLIIK